MKKVIEDIYRRFPVIQNVYRPCRAMYAKRRLRRTVSRERVAGRPLRLVIGANSKGQPGWIPTEAYSLNLLVQEDWDRCFAEGSVEMLVAEHVWEHLTMEQGRMAAEICYKYLAAGGHLRVAVPDGLFPDDAYIEFVRPGGTGPSAFDHKVLYTYKTLSELFLQVGFEVILREYFDESGQFHESEWSAADGRIVRSRKFYNGHAFGQFKYRSLILDARKPVH